MVQEVPTQTTKKETVRGNTGVVIDTKLTSLKKDQGDINFDNKEGKTNGLVNDLTKECAWIRSGKLQAPKRCHISFQVVKIPLTNIDETDAYFK